MANAGSITGLVTNSATFNNNAGGVVGGGLREFGGRDHQRENGASINGGASVTGGIVNNAGALSGANVSIGGNGTLATTGTVNATTSVTNAGVVNATGVIITPNFTNSGTFNLTGNVNAGASAPNTIGAFNNSGLVNFTSSGTLNATTFNNAGMVTASAPTNVNVSTFNNSGTITLNSSTTIGATNLNNLGTGVIAFSGTGTTNTLKITGGYAGASGSDITLNINTTNGFSSANTVTIGGVVSGASVVKINNTGQAALFAPVPIIFTGGGNATFTISDTSSTFTNPFGELLVAYGIQRFGNQYDLTAALSPVALSSVGGSIGSGDWFGFDGVLPRRHRVRRRAPIRRRITSTKASGRASPMA